MNSTGGECYNHKWNFKPKISSIFHFELENDGRISHILYIMRLPKAARSLKIASNLHSVSFIWATGSSAQQYLPSDFSPQLLSSKVLWIKFLVVSVKPPDSLSDIRSLVSGHPLTQWERVCGHRLANENSPNKIRRRGTNTKRSILLNSNLKLDCLFHLIGKGVDYWA